jgi:hypothetical protein
MSGGAMVKSQPVTLYQVADQYLAALADLTERDDLPEEVVRDTLDSLKGDLAVKGISVACHALNVELGAKLLRERADALAAMAKREEERSEKLKAYLCAHLLRAGLPKIEHDGMTVKLRKSGTPRVEIEGKDGIPAEFMRIPEPPPLPPPEPDRVAIREAIKGGTPVAGCRLVYSYSVKIEG